MIPTVMWHRAIPVEPAIIRGLRPTLSMTQMAGMVVPTLMKPRTPVARSEMVLLVRPSDWNMLGA